MFNDLHIAAFGVSPYLKTTIPLGDYNADHYLTLLYHAFQNLKWHIGYFDHDGIIAYTNISWPSYSEEISVRVYPHEIVIKSECVGYQALFTDYGRNEDNLERLFTEIDYAEFHLRNDLEQSAQQLMNTIPEKQFLSLDDPPMAGKEKLRGFFSVFTPQKKYFITPILVLTNIAVFVISIVALGVMLAMTQRFGRHFGTGNGFEKLFLSVGFNNRSQVLHGQVWRLLTNTFLHFSVWHLLGNMIVLIYIGSLIETKLGRWNFLFLYLFTGIIASMVSVIYHLNGVSGGASGAIFGLFGILLALLSTNFYERSARRALLISTGIFVGYHLIPFPGATDHAAHLGGLIAGYVLGLLAYAGLSNPNPAMKKWGISIGGSVVTILFIAGSIWLTPDYHLQDYFKLYTKSRQIAETIQGDLYTVDSVRNHKLLMLEHTTLPEINDLYKAATAMEKVPLPSNLKKIANVQTHIVKVKCAYFKLLYKQFKEDDIYKYKHDIRGKTDELYNLSQQLSDLEQEQNTSY